MSLTQEDKDWMKEWVREELHGTETRLSAELQNLMKGWVREELHGTETRLSAEFRQELHSMETKLLTEFHKWASPMDMRVKSHSAALRVIDLELEAATNRITDLEDRTKSN